MLKKLKNSAFDKTMPSFKRRRKNTTETLKIALTNIKPMHITGINMLIIFGGAFKEFLRFFLTKKIPNGNRTIADLRYG